MLENFRGLFRVVAVAFKQRHGTDGNFSHAMLCQILTALATTLISQPEMGTPDETHRRAFSSVVSSCARRERVLAIHRNDLCRSLGRRLCHGKSCFRHGVTRGQSFALESED
jgi:hypothetical protein